MRKLKLHLLTLTLVISSLGISFESLSQSTTSDTKSNTIIIQPKTPPGFEIVSSETLKMLFAIKEQKEAEAKAASAVIAELVNDRDKKQELIDKQDETILLYKENGKNYEILQQSFKDNIEHNNKLISGLEFKVKVWKGVAIAIPILGGAAYTYFTFIK
jgi:hypothetical protein